MPVTKNVAMSKDNDLEMDGVVMDHKAGDNFTVEVAGMGLVNAKLAGKMRHNNIRVTVGDRVKIKFSALDGSKTQNPLGMIVFRYK